jgi:hypothetical protein
MHDIERQDMICHFVTVLEGPELEAVSFGD